MRVVTSWTLIVLILTCPLFCAVGECGACADAACPAGGCDCDPSPSSCPNDSGNCVCAGAILSAFARSHDLDAAGPLLPFDGPSAVTGPGILMHRVHLSHRGWLADPCVPGSALAACAWLQDFRC